MTALVPGELAALAFEEAPLGLIYSEHRVIVRANMAFAAMFGFTVDEIQGRSLALLYPSRGDFERIGATGLSVMRGTGSYQDERVMARRDGTLFWCRVTGKSLTPEDPFAHAVWCFADLSNRIDLSRLSPREKDVAVLVGEGRTAKDMARTLGLSPRTVEACLARLRRKLGVKNIAELVNRIVAR